MEANEIVRERLKLMRKTEGLTQDEFAELIDIAVGTVRNFEQIGTISFAQLQKIFAIPRFSRYFMWFFKGEIFPTIGQISPDILADIKTKLKSTKPDFNKSDEVSNDEVKEHCADYQTQAPMQTVSVDNVLEDVSKALKESLERNGIR
jgi:transcriptional regulator with XRE-family HTH domain